MAVQLNFVLSARIAFQRHFAEDFRHLVRDAVLIERVGQGCNQLSCVITGLTLEGIHGIAEQFLAQPMGPELDNTSVHAPDVPRFPGRLNTAPKRLLSQRLDGREFRVAMNAILDAHISPLC